jgi:hypothetical protein
VTGAWLRLPSTQGVFSGSSRRHDKDLISEPNPFVEDVKLGDSYLTQITQRYVPVLADGAAPRGKGIAIPGITDGFSGEAPDMGTLIAGRAIPEWGDRSAPAAQQSDRLK